MVPTAELEVIPVFLLGAFQQFHPLFFSEAYRLFSLLQVFTILPLVELSIFVLCIPSLLWHTWYLSVLYRMYAP